MVTGKHIIMGAGGVNGIYTFALSFEKEEFEKAISLINVSENEVSEEIIKVLDDIKSKIKKLYGVGRWQDFLEGSADPILFIGDNLFANSKSAKFMELLLSSLNKDVIETQKFARLEDLKAGRITRDQFAISLKPPTFFYSTNATTFIPFDDLINFSYVQVSLSLEKDTDHISKVKDISEMFITELTNANTQDSDDIAKRARLGYSFVIDVTKADKATIGKFLGSIAYYSDMPIHPKTVFLVCSDKQVEELREYTKEFYIRLSVKRNKYEGIPIL